MKTLTKSLTQILVMVFEETYFLKPLSKQNCLINIHECIMFLNQKPCILNFSFLFGKIALNAYYHDSTTFIIDVYNFITIYI